MVIQNFFNNINLKETRKQQLGKHRKEGCPIHKKQNVGGINLLQHVVRLYKKAGMLTLESDTKSCYSKVVLLLTQSALNS